MTFQVIRSSVHQEYLLNTTQYFHHTGSRMTPISQVIKDDHRELEDAYNQTLRAVTSDAKLRWRNQFAGTVFSDNGRVN